MYGLGGYSNYVYLTVFEHLPYFDAWGRCSIGIKEDYVRANANKFRDYSLPNPNKSFSQMIDDLDIKKLNQGEANLPIHRAASNQLLSLSPIPIEALEFLVCPFEEINKAIEEINPSLPILDSRKRTNL